MNKNNKLYDTLTDTTTALGLNFINWYIEANDGIFCGKPYEAIQDAEEFLNTLTQQQLKDELEKFHQHQQNTLTKTTRVMHEINILKQQLS